MPGEGFFSGDDPDLAFNGVLTVSQPREPAPSASGMSTITPDTDPERSTDHDETPDCDEVQDC